MQNATPPNRGHPEGRNEVKERRSRLTAVRRRGWDQEIAHCVSRPRNPAPDVDVERLLGIALVGEEEEPVATIPEYSRHDRSAQLVALRLTNTPLSPRMSRT